VTDIDECATNNGGCHNTLANCANNDGSFTCACNTGYAGDGVTCTGKLKQWLCFTSFALAEDLMFACV